MPPKYASADFLKTDYWRLRGKLDVPKERWISYPHLPDRQRPSAGRRLGRVGPPSRRPPSSPITTPASERAGTPSGSRPLLAGLDQLLPWIHQWHPEIDPEFGETAGQSYQTMLEHDAHELGLTLEDIRNWQPPEKPRKTRTTRKKKASSGGRRMTSAQLHAKLKELLALPAETEWVEFKHNNSDPQELGEYLSALSNSAALKGQPLACIVWGVKDGTQQIVEGTTFEPQSTKASWERRPRTWQSSPTRRQRIDFQRSTSSDADGPSGRACSRGPGRQLRTPVPSRAVEVDSYRQSQEAAARASREGTRSGDSCPHRSKTGRPRSATGPR